MTNPDPAHKRLLIVDDHDLVRDTIAAFVESTSSLEVLKASSLAAALEVLRTEGPVALVLLDYNMPGMNGLEGLPMVIEANAHHPVALLSGAASRSIAEQALSKGAAGFVPKTLGGGSIVAAINFMIAGEVFAPFDFMFQLEKTSEISLTSRERQVLAQICEAKSNKEIARELDIHEATVKMHVRELTRKLQAKNRTHAALIARDRQLV